MNGILRKILISQNKSTSLLVSLLLNFRYLFYFRNEDSEWNVSNKSKGKNFIIFYYNYFSSLKLKILIVQI